MSIDPIPGPGDVVVITAGEWSALYVDGKLDTAGDNYLADERIRELFGITNINEDDGGRAVLPTGCQREDVPATLAEAQQKINEHHIRIDNAKQLREQAAAMVAEADRLEGKA